ncbi:MAG: hypothetical protein ACI8UO_005982 [Verrucomicrobiales bacterium]|jgi:uncharacterized protein (DUF302 family)
MKYIVTTEKSIEQASVDLEAAVKRNGFGVLHMYDLQQTLKSKGVDLPNACRIYEICNPQKAEQVLKNDMTLNMALPCRISVFQHNGETQIGMIRPRAMLSMLSDDDALATVAEEVESISIRIIDEAK